MNVYGGVIFSQQVLLALVQKGLSREDAYLLVQRNAHTAWNTEGGNFKANLLADADVTSHLSPAELEQCFDPAKHLRYLDTVYARVL